MEGWYQKHEEQRRRTDRLVKCPTVKVKSKGVQRRNDLNILCGPDVPRWYKPLSGCSDEDQH